MCCCDMGCILPSHSLQYSLPLHERKAQKVWQSQIFTSPIPMIQIKGCLLLQLSRDAKCLSFPKARPKVRAMGRLKGRVKMAHAGNRIPPQQPISAFFQCIQIQLSSCSPALLHSAQSGNYSPSSILIQYRIQDDNLGTSGCITVTPSSAPAHVDALCKWLTKRHRSLVVTPKSGATHGKFLSGKKI